MVDPAKAKVVPHSQLPYYQHHQSGIFIYISARVLHCITIISFLFFFFLAEEDASATQTFLSTYISSTFFLSFSLFFFYTTRHENSWWQWHRDRNLRMDPDYPVLAARPRYHALLLLHLFQSTSSILFQSGLVRRFSSSSSSCIERRSPLFEIIKGGRTQEKSRWKLRVTQCFVQVCFSLIYRQRRRGGAFVISYFI